MTVGAFETSWSPARVAASPSLFLVPNVILKGGNIAPKPTHGTTGHTIRDQFAEWDWSGWIKPQIDALHGIGGNSVRLIGDLEGVNDGTFTQAYYDAKWAQLIDYCASIGMYVYPALGGVSQVASAALTVPQIGTTLAAAAAPMEAKKATVIGLDLLQESVRKTVAGSYALVYPSELTTPVRAVTTIPLTFSNPMNTTDGWGRLENPLWKDVLRPYVDFWDFHTYIGMLPSVIYDAFWGHGETKPVLIGEFGADATRGAAAQTVQFQNTAAIVNNRTAGLHVAGAFAWSVFDQGTGANAFGMFETDGTPRTAMTVPFQTLLTAA